MGSNGNGFAFREPSEKARSIVARDEKALSPSYTRSYGFTVSHGKGAEVWDVDGNRYVDFASGIAVLSTGYNHPRVVEAIRKQTEKYIHIGGTDFFDPLPIELAERLQQIVPINRAEAPDDKLVFFSNSGTEAIEAALKLARYQGRNHIIGFYGSFHGRTMGSLSVTASKSTQRAKYPYIPGGVTHIPYPARNSCAGCGDGSGCCAQCWCDSVGFIEHFVFKKVDPQEVAAVLVEPIQGEGGYVLPRDDFFPRLRELCDKHGILLIVDEIQSGVGRTGKFLAVEHFGVQPDIVCMAKGLASGVPMGATIAHKDVMGQWVPGAHGNTFGGNPLASAAALATLDVIYDEKLMDNATQLGAYTKERLTRFMADHPSLTRVDGFGFMIGMDFCAPDGTPLPQFRDALVDACYVNGLLTLGCGKASLRFAPPLMMPRDLLDEGLDILEHSIAQVEEALWDALVSA